MDLQERALANLLLQADNWLTVTPAPPAVLRVPGGYVNPSGHDKAMAALVRDSQAVLSLSLAWRLTREMKYAARAAEVLTAWRATLKEVTGFDSQLAFVSKGLALLDAWLNLGEYSWDRGPFLNLVNNLYAPAARALTVHPNNPGAWGWCGLVMADHIQGRSHQVSGVLNHIKGAVNLDSGDLWREDRRTNSGIWYTAWTLEAYTKILFIFKRDLNQDYFGLLLPAYKRLAEFVLNPSTWPHPLPKGIAGRIWRVLFPCADQLEIAIPGRWPSGLLETLLAQKIKFAPWLEPNIETWLDQARPIGEGDAFRFSTLKYCYNLEP